MHISLLTSNRDGFREIAKFSTDSKIIIVIIINGIFSVTRRKGVAGVKDRLQSFDSF